MSNQTPITDACEQVSPGDPADAGSAHEQLERAGELGVVSAESMQLASGLACLFVGESSHGD